MIGCMMRVKESEVIVMNIRTVLELTLDMPVAQRIKQAKKYFCDSCSKSDCCSKYADELHIEIKLRDLTIKCGDYVAKQ